jgi:hypothetical protein
MINNYITGQIDYLHGTIPKVSHKLDFSDLLGTIMVRWGINRDSYRVTPGIYAVGSPDTSSNVFVTANYKLSFDTLRKNLSGIDGWILVLDTKGINVWCAAGKGTFGTKELIRQINKVSLEKIIDHKRIILPQLGAVGVAAHEVKKETGFNVHYGPVRAVDIKKFIDSGYRADKEMRKVKFGLWDRIKLIPVELVSGKFYLLGALVLITLLSCIGLQEFSPGDIWGKINISVINILAAYISGIVITPIFLPYLPGRSFSFKGFCTGIIISALMLFLKMSGGNIFEIISWFLLISGVSSFLAMNFTGTSTFTSLSGVKKEMRVAVPLQITLAASGIILLVLGKFLY